MAATPSKMVPLGSSAPDFNLYNPILNKYQSLKELKSDIATVIMFICNHCPFVKFINSALVDLTNEYIEKGISFIGINSNDVINYPEDSPSKMIEYSKILGYKFPYLYDETQEVAKSYDAACTPDFFVYDKDLKLVYRGQFDDARPTNGLVPSGKDLRYSLDCILNNKQIDIEQKPSIGCNIKWK